MRNKKNCCMSGSMYVNLTAMGMGRRKNSSYPSEKEGKTEAISEEEYYAAFDKYKQAAVVSFAYGASDAAGH